MTARSTWYAVPAMDPLTTIAAEVREAFGPVREWRRAAPCEQTATLWQQVTDTVPALVMWGWDVAVTHGQRGSLTVTASRSFGNRRAPVTATGRGVNLPDALAALGERLTDAVLMLDPEAMEDDAA
ncbi:MAG: hypothetical protein QM753_12075 [Thermomicrobiales bacterium]